MLSVLPAKMDLFGGGGSVLEHRPPFFFLFSLGVKSANVRTQVENEAAPDGEDVSHRARSAVR